MQLLSTFGEKHFEIVFLGLFSSRAVRDTCLFVFLSVARTNLVSKDTLIPAQVNIKVNVHSLQGSYIPVELYIWYVFVR